MEHISVMVLAYNSADTIIETLESIYAQTYPKIELIIGIDGSEDNTKEVVDEWVNEKKSRFEYVKIVFHSTNQGTSKNINYALEYVKTKWLKIIAADDILHEECLWRFYEFVSLHPECEKVVSDLVRFKVVNGKKEFLKDDLREKQYLINIAKKDAYKQYKSLLKKDIVYSPADFVNADAVKELGGMDERFRNIEDWPFRLKWTSSGKKIYFFDKVTVYYRMSNSVSRDESGVYKESHIRGAFEIKRILCYPDIPKWHILYYYEEFVERVKYFVIIKALRNKNGIASTIAKILFNILSPSRLVRYILSMGTNR